MGNDSDTGPRDAQWPERMTDLVEVDDLRDTMRVERATLEVIEGPDAGNAITIRQHRVVVGGAPTCDLVLADATTSWRHFEIFHTDDGYELRDAGSTNGTLVRGLRVRSVVLGPSEEIKVGFTRLAFNATGEHDEVPISPRGSFGAMLGSSKVMRQTFAMLEAAARSDATVLLEGESGTGKDLAAESLHEHSARADGPFVVVDCGSVSQNLVGSELFGHCRGAFTGADRDRPGAFEAASGGTVFLDEISSLDLSLQPQLLRVLERREVKRVGENRYRPVDVRIIAATNRELAGEVKAGRFREDLFYRLSVVRVPMPPLRDRTQDVPRLAAGFIDRLAGEGASERIINEELLALFYNHDWPGNVRELRNVVERLVVLPGFPTQLAAPTAGAAAAPTADSALSRPYQVWKDRFERDYLRALMEAVGGVVRDAAERSGIARPTLYRMLRRHNLTGK